jgi:hypothetical protein
MRITPRRGGGVFFERAPGVAIVVQQLDDGLAVLEPVEGVVWCGAHRRLRSGERHAFSVAQPSTYLY